MDVSLTFDRRGARAKEHAARPPARFSSLWSTEPVNQKQEPWGNTLWHNDTCSPGNSYFWRTAGRRPAEQLVPQQFRFAQPRVSDNIMKVVLAYLLIGSYTLLFLNWRQNRSVAAGVQTVANRA